MKKLLSALAAAALLAGCGETDDGTMTRIATAYGVEPQALLLK